MLRDVTATRYITPLREGGSLPGLIEADDLNTYVLKFTAPGRGARRSSPRWSAGNSPAGWASGCRGW